MPRHSPHPAPCQSADNSRIPNFRAGWIALPLAETATGSRCRHSEPRGNPNDVLARQSLRRAGTFPISV